jgi:hypothetical protein
MLTFMPLIVTEEQSVCLPTFMMPGRTMKSFDYSYAKVLSIRSSSTAKFHNLSKQLDFFLLRLFTYFFLDKVLCL